MERSFRCRGRALRALAMVALGAMVAAPPAALAQPKGEGVDTAVGSRLSSDGQDLMDGTDLETVIGEIRDLGYQAKTLKLSDGRTAIDSASSGIKFRVTFYSCEGSEPHCTIDFGAGWLTSKNPVPLAKLNEWNRKYRFTKAYNDSDNDLTLKMYMTLTEGVTRKNFRANFERWISQLAEFEAFRKSK